MKRHFDKPPKMRQYNTLQEKGSSEWKIELLHELSKRVNVRLKGNINLTLQNALADWMNSIIPNEYDREVSFWLTYDSENKEMIVYQNYIDYKNFEMSEELCLAERLFPGTGERILYSFISIDEIFTPYDVNNMSTMYVEWAEDSDEEPDTKGEFVFANGETFNPSDLDRFPPWAIKPKMTRHDPIADGIINAADKLYAIQQIKYRDYFVFPGIVIWDNKTSLTENILSEEEIAQMESGYEIQNGQIKVGIGNSLEDALNSLEQNVRAYMTLLNEIVKFKKIMEQYKNEH